MYAADTILARATPAGRAARAVIRLSGPATFEALGRILAHDQMPEMDPHPRAPHPPRALRTRLRLGPHTMPALLLVFCAPRSYTGEDAAEIQLPGNPHLIDRLFDDLLRTATCRRAEPGEFTARAYLNGRMSLDQAEAVAAIIGAEHETQLAAARRLLSGETGSLYRRWADELANLLALVEAGIDFADEEEVVPIAPTELHARISDLTTRIDDAIGPGRPRSMRTDRPLVALVGAPNAGKSTLFNALLGRPRAVTSDRRGTTRDVLIERLTLPGPTEIDLADLAGLAPGEDAATPADRAAAAQALRVTASADALIHCDPTGIFPDLPGCPSGARILRVRTKADLIRPGGPSADLAVCALDGWHTDLLVRSLTDLVAAGGPTDLPARHIGLLVDVRARLGELIARETVAPAELTAQGLRHALDALGELTGRITPDDVLGRVFSSFCIGK